MPEIQITEYDRIVESKVVKAAFIDKIKVLCQIEPRRPDMHANRNGIPVLVDGQLGAIPFREPVVLPAFKYNELLGKQDMIDQGDPYSFNIVVHKHMDIETGEPCTVNYMSLIENELTIPERLAKLAKESEPANEPEKKVVPPVKESPAEPESNEDDDEVEEDEKGTEYFVEKDEEEGDYKVVYISKKGTKRTKKRNFMHEKDAKNFIDSL